MRFLIGMILHNKHHILYVQFTWMAPLFAIFHETQVKVSSKASLINSMRSSPGSR